MKIAILKPNLQGKGGLEKWTFRIAENLSKEGLDVTILASGEYPKDSSYTIHSVKLPKWPPSLKIDQFDLKATSFVQTNYFDKILGMERTSFQTHLRAGSGVHAAFLKAREHQDSFLKSYLLKINPLHRKILEIEKKAFESFFLEKIFVNSQMVKDEILNFYQVDEKKIITIHNGVEWEEWEEPFSNWKIEKEVILKKLNLSSEKTYLLFAGNGYKRKGLELLLKALALSKREDLSLLVIGKEKNLSSYQKITHQLKIENKVHFFGPQKEILSFYQIADVAVIPSIYDPFANVTVEALAMGLFVISSKQNGGHEILKQETGVVIDLYQKESLELWIEALKKVTKKTKESSNQIRNSIQNLDMKLVLDKITKELY